MNHAVVVLCAAALLVGACGKKDDSADKSAPAPASSATGASSATAGAPAQPDPNHKPATKAADAAPEPAGPKPGQLAAQRESYGKAMARGRKLINAHNNADAAEAFRAALKVRPKNAMALSELSWALFEAGDLEGAVAAATSAADGAKNDPSTQAASLYNRGRAQEALKDTKSAIADYQESYRLRPHPVVRKRLLALEAEVPESVWTARVLEGPYASVRDFCKTSTGCRQDRGGDAKIKALKLPWAVSAATVATMDEVELGFQETLLFETSQGWYALRAFEQWHNRYDYEVDKLELVDGRIAIHVTNEEGRFATSHNRTVTVCGVGDSGRPSCFGPLSLADWEIGYEGGKEDGHSLPTEHGLACSAKLVVGDLLNLKAENKSCRAKISFAGEHKLVFP